MAALIGISLKPKDGDESASATVPLDLLGEDGVPPEEGDDVSFSVDGTVKSIDGENATIDITAINGEPVKESASQEAAEDQNAPAGPSSASMRPALAKQAAANRMPIF